MFNTYQYNTSQYNAQLSFTQPPYPILQFNGYSFENANFRLKNLPDIADVDTTEFQTYNIASDHGQ
jgi:hypothetical protein